MDNFELFVCVFFYDFGLFVCVFFMKFDEVSFREELKIYSTIMEGKTKGKNLGFHY